MNENIYQIGQFIVFNSNGNIGSGTITDLPGQFTASVCLASPCDGLDVDDTKIVLLDDILPNVPTWTEPISAKAWDDAAERAW